MRLELSGIPRGCVACSHARAIPMVLGLCRTQYATASSTGSFLGASGCSTVRLSIAGIVKTLGDGSSFGSASSGQVRREPPGSSTSNSVVSTDPPYYDNIGYADLSDFFYVWLRRSLRSVFPDLFATLVPCPKTDELVATPYRLWQQGEGREVLPRRHDVGDAAPNADQAHLAFPVTIYYAFKQSETPRRLPGLH